jgi:hypothetical protein
VGTHVPIISGKKFGAGREIFLRENVSSKIFYVKQKSISEKNLNNCAKPMLRKAFLVNHSYCG